MRIGQFLAYILPIGSIPFDTLQTAGDGVNPVHPMRAHVDADVTRDGDSRRDEVGAIAGVQEGARDLGLDAVICPIHVPVFGLK